MQTDSELKNHGLFLQFGLDSIVISNVENGRYSCNIRKGNFNEIIKFP